MSERKLLGKNLSYTERIALAQLVQQPGWEILVRLMAEACREATEECIKLDPITDRYPEKVAGLQMTARAMNKFSSDILASVKLHQRTAVVEAQKSELGHVEEGTTTRFQGFRMPAVQSPKPEGAQ